MDSCQDFSLSCSEHHCPDCPAWKDPLPDIDAINATLRRARQGAPSTNPKDIIGQTKPAISVVPPVALFHIGQAMSDGKEKYGLMNWREHPVKASVYYDAALRHLMSWWDGEQRASDSNVHHLAHAAACMCILLDAESGGNLVDDKPLKGMLAEFIKANTKG